MECNHVTCPRSVYNTSRILKRNVPDIRGRCADCKKFLSQPRSYWENPKSVSVDAASINSEMVDTSCPKIDTPKNAKV